MAAPKGDRTMTRETLLRTAGAIALGAAILIGSPVLAASNSAVTIGPRGAAGEMTIPVNKSQLLRVNREFSEITVGNKEIADVVPISKTEAYIMGKKPGSTSVAIVDGNGKAIAV